MTQLELLGLVSCLDYWIITGKKKKKKKTDFVKRPVALHAHKLQIISVQAILNKKLQ